MTRFNPADKWRVTQFKKEKKQEKLLRQMGIMKNGVVNPYALRTLSGNCSGKMSTKHVAILAGVILALAAIGGFAYWEMNHGHDDGNHNPPVENKAPTIDSWDIQTGTYAPKIWVNASDDKSVESIALEVYKPTGEKVFEKSYAPQTKTAKITDNLSLSALAEGQYKVKVVAIDKEGKKSTTLEKMIDLPMTTPVAPEVDKPWIYWVESTHRWHIQGNATDKNGDLKYIYLHVKWADGTNETALGPETHPVSGSKASAEIVGEFIKDRKYWVDVWAEDSKGQICEKKFAYFEA